MTSLSVIVKRIFLICSILDICPSLHYQSIIQTALIQQEIIDAHNQHPIVIVIRCRYFFRDDDLLEEIDSQHQGAMLLFHLCPIWNRIDRLNIIPLRAFITDKINFRLFADSITFFIGFIQSDNSHIHIKTAYLQLIEDDIFHKMSFFQLTEIETGIPQPQIVKVISDRCVDILLTLNIISDSTVDQEGLTLLKIADNFVGFVSEPIADEKIFRSSSHSARLRTLCLPTISEIQVSSNSDFKKLIFSSGPEIFMIGGKAP